ncbi:hypothetical protein G4Y79_00640 [Phototrophicus methaneseepsis]|uniref:Uncharacterized protein n=1 Tax=Phototrophicus methaneseepsis TaxID=2710758 RepID=A0A7S8E9M2_9CHLR|nr:hypothetical protein [Phototrophicus methaneseepsis]QPC82912.1 hypothetical protein G4Y79_00640 [Phototrophicus methaneseepsis]
MEQQTHRTTPRRTQGYTPDNYKTDKFWSHWIGGSMLVWPISVVVAAVIFVPTAFFFGSLLQIHMFDYTGTRFSDLLMGGVMTVIAGGAIGFAVGSIQQYILKNILLWTADRWTLASVLGGIAGGIIVGFMFLMDDPSLYYVHDVTIFTAMPIYITVLSMVQYLALRVAVRSGWLWVLANLVGGLVFSGLLLRNSLDPAVWGDLIASLGMWALAIIAQGAVTGYVLLFLFERHAYPYEEDEDDSIEEGVTRTPGQHSVWDKAI